MKIGASTAFVSSKADFFTFTIFITGILEKKKKRMFYSCVKTVIMKSIAD